MRSFVALGSSLASIQLPLANGNYSIWKSGAKLSKHSLIFKRDHYSKSKRVNEDCPISETPRICSPEFTFESVPFGDFLSEAESESNDALKMSRRGISSVCEPSEDSYLAKVTWYHGSVIS